MKIKHYENIVKYLPVLLVCVLIGVFGRLRFIKTGADEYTANTFFWVCIGFGIFSYALIVLFLQGIIENRFIKPFKKNENIPELLDNQIDAFKEQEDVTEKQLALHKEQLVFSENFEKIKEEQQTIVLNKHKTKIEKAIHYTQKQFVLHTTDDDLKLLCDYIVMYANNIDFENVIPISVKNLSSLDIYHFGWNIWNHFKTQKQEKIALFLKIVFAQALKDSEVESIKRHLRDDERKGIIVITQNLSDS